MDEKGIQALLTEADGFYSAHSEVMNLVCGLAAALKASEERAREAEDLAAANLAANKRIVELEREADRLITQRDRWEEQVGDMAASVGCEEEFSNWHDHKDCVEERVAVLKTERDAARTELARLTTPRPIAEAPATGKVRGLWLDDNGKIEREEVVTLSDGHMRDWHDEPFYCPVMGDPSHYLPLPEAKP